MPRAPLLILLFAFAFSSMSSCSMFRKKASTEPPVIRTMNLEAVYGFVLNREGDAVQLKGKIQKLSEKVKELEQRLEAEEGNRTVIKKELNESRAQLAELARKSAALRAKILERINRAVKGVSSRIKGDIVINYGEDIIYVRKEYDITEDVIRELMRIEQWSEPVSR